MYELYLDHSDVELLNFMFLGNRLDGVLLGVNVLLHILCDLRNRAKREKKSKFTRVKFGDILLMMTGVKGTWEKAAFVKLFLKLFLKIIRLGV